jgi:phage-related protein (TIGR01555 family)
MYLSCWEARKIVEIPIIDALRKDFKILNIEDHAKIDALKAALKNFDLYKIIRECLIISRVDGGCALFIGYGDPNLSSPPKKNAPIKYFRSIKRDSIDITSLYTFSPTQDLKLTYTINGEEIHPERLIIFPGMGSVNYSLDNQYVFSSSVLLPVFDDILRATRIREEVAYLTKRASCLVMSTENRVLSDENKRKQIEDTLQSIDNKNSVILDDLDVKIHEFSTSFGALPELILTTLKILGSALDVPITRFLGLSNSGLTQSADGDLENYYNFLQQIQNNHIAPSYIRILKHLYISLFGYDTSVDTLDIEFPPLWNNSDKEVMEINNIKMDQIMKAINSGLMTSQEGVDEINLSHVFQTSLTNKDLEIESFNDSEDLIN